MKEQILFQRYLNNELNEEQLIYELDLLQVKNVKGDGVIYTPKNIVDAMVKLAAPKLNETIIEPSCGHGIFLISILEYISKNYNLTGAPLFQWFVNKVTAIDINSNSVNSTQKILAAYFIKNHNYTTFAANFCNVLCHDGLTWHNNSYTLSIGNPPYIRAKNLSKDYLNFLKQNFISCQIGTIDIYYAFIEKYQKQCQRVIYITPNSYLTNKSGQKLRELVLPKLKCLIDFKEKKVFSDASVYTCISEVTQATQEDFLYGNDISNQEKISKNLIFQENQAINSRISTILSGIATLCDKVFLVKKENNKYFASLDGIKYEIEEGILSPYIKITKLKTSDLSNIDYVICPYDKQNKIISEQIITENFPKAYAFLNKAKKLLLARDKGKTDKYEAWYAYGRKQGLHTYNATKFTAIPLMLGNGCSPVQIDISQQLKKFNRVLFSSGFLIPETKETPYSLFISKDFNEYTKKYGKPWPGKNNPYYSLNATQLKKF